MDSVSQLTSTYLDGDLNAAEQATLHRWLHEDDAHVDEFVIDCFVHTQLVDLLSSHQMRANALVAAELAATPEYAPRSRRYVGRLLAVAVSVLVAAAFLLLLTSRRSVVATVTGTSNAKWSSVGEDRKVGSLVNIGDEIAIDTGTVRLAFAGGGQVVVQGPSRFRVDSDMSAQLLQGRVSAFVPEHAVGFTVRTKRLKLVDLGTEFRLELHADDSCDLQVFDGLVEVEYEETSKNERTHKTLQMVQGRAVQFDAVTNGVKTIDYNASLRLPTSAWSQ